jgi:hypothetical protein
MLFQRGCVSRTSSLTLQKRQLSSPSQNPSLGSPEINAEDEPVVPVQPSLDVIFGGGRKRAQSASLENTLTDDRSQSPGTANLLNDKLRLPSPLLTADISFREDFLIDHYFNHPFRRQFFNNAIRGTKIPNQRVIQSLIDENPALRHAVCALACLTFPSHPPPSQREILAHAGLAVAFLRKLIGSQYLDEGILLAIVEIVDFEVDPYPPVAICSAGLQDILPGLYISTLP